MKESIETMFIMLNTSLNSRLQKRIDGQLGMHGLSFTEYLIMHHLNNGYNKTMRRIDLAECVGISPSGVTRVIAPMEKNRIVEKEANPRDARMSLVKLSATGERLYKESSVGFEHTAKKLLEKLDQGEIQQLIDISKKLM